MGKGQNRKTPVVMVSSSVYGQEELLDRIYVLLTSLDYEVWMSHKGTIPTNSDETSVESCLRAVKNCDSFLGLITTNYGKTEYGNISITHQEFRKAIELKKPRWFLVHERVIFARQLLNKLGYKTPEERHALGKDKLKPLLSDLRILDMYEDAAERRITDGQSKVKWVQQFIDTDDAALFAQAQFSRFLDAEMRIREQYPDLTGKGGGK